VIAGARRTARRLPMAAMPGAVPVRRSNATEAVGGRLIFRASGRDIASQYADAHAVIDPRRNPDALAAAAIHA